MEMAELFFDVFKSNFDEETEKIKYKLWDLNFKGCHSCMKCKEGPDARCVINDEMRQVLIDAENSDYIILATPVYFGTINSEAKAFIDRGFSFLPSGMGDDTVGRLKNSRVICIYTQGSTEANAYVEEFQRLGSVFNNMGAQSFFVVSIIEPPDDLDKETVLNEVRGYLENDVIPEMLQYHDDMTETEDAMG